MKKCVICDNNEGKYKCPTCLIYYCSLFCCKKHRETKCEVAKVEVKVPEQKSRKFVTDDTVPEKKLKLLAHNKELKELLQNPHLKNLLQIVDASKKPVEIMQKAMLEPIFVEFADVCMNIVEPPET